LQLKQENWEKTRLVKHHINTEGQGPIRLRPYRIHQNNKRELESILQELLVNKLIRPSVSPWAAPVVLVKKSGGIRLCMDYRKLTSITKKESFPLPRIDSILSNKVFRDSNVARITNNLHLFDE
jgi:hypothetical protein